MSEMEAELIRLQALRMLAGTEGWEFTDKATGLPVNRAEAVARIDNQLRQLKKGGAA